MSHHWVHQTNEFNCHLDALFVIDPTLRRCAPYLTSHETVDPRYLQLTFLCEAPDQGNDRPRTKSSAAFPCWYPPLRRLTVAARNYAVGGVIE